MICMRLSHNLASLNIYNQLSKNEKLQSKAMNRISTGVKVSRAADDPYVLAQSENQRMQIRGLQMAQRNVQDGVSMLQTNDSALSSVTSMLQRIRELTIQAGGVTTSDDKTTIQNEISQMVKGIDDVVNNTEFNGVKLLNDSTVASNSVPNNIKMAGGSNSSETINIPVFNFISSKLGDESSGKFLNSVDVTTPNGIDEGLGIIDSSLKTIIGAQSKIGALENRFESMYNNLGTTSDTIQSSESEMRDSDISLEMVELSKNGILIEAGNALLAQTNRFPMEILKILENVR
jgi:flagellin